MTQEIRRMPPQPLAIEVVDLEKAFGTVQAIRGASCAVRAGETVAMLGPNGAGKSTTIEVILGLLEPDAGSVRVLGRTPSQAVAEGRVGAMLQTGQLLSHLRVRELLAMVASLYPNPRPVDEVLELAGLADVAQRRTTKLSGGQAQRVRFALSIVGAPELLVLDEPTVALDVEGRIEFWRAVEEVARQGTTVLFATHYLEEADAHAERILLMARGQVIADGPPSAIKATVGQRTISATAPRVDPSALASLPGVRHARRQGERIELACTDADQALYALVRTVPDLRDIEVRGAELEDAFVELTRSSAEVNR
jgi:ABC-2 type transport system ATP-binding protein